MVFRRTGFSPVLRLLVPAFSLRIAPDWVPPTIHRRYERSPTTRTLHTEDEHFPARPKEDFWELDLTKFRLFLMRNAHVESLSSFVVMQTKAMSYSEYFTLCEVYESAVSVICLSPDHLRRKDSRPVSCYAFFKGWLLLSQPPGCWRILTSSSCTEHIFWDLNWRSGLFPFRPMELLPHSLTAEL